MFFFCFAPSGAATFRRGQSKKKTPPRVSFFFAPASGKGRGRRSPVGRRHGARAKKKTTQGVFFLLRPRGTPQGFLFFCSGPGERQGKEKPRWARARGRSKNKKHHPGCFCFLLRPRGKAGEGEAPLGAGTGPEQKKNTTQGVFFFCSGPGERQGKEKLHWAPARGQSKKKHHPVCFFCSGPGETQGKEKPRWAPARGSARRGHSKKKKTRVVFFFFAAAPRGRSLTHCGPGWRCLGPAGPQQKKKTTRVVFFFLLRPRADAHSLTAGLGGNASARRGHSKQKRHPGWCFFFCCGPARTLTQSLRAWVAMPWPGGPQKKKKTPRVVLFLLLRPRADAHSLTAGLGGDASARRSHSKKKKHPGWCFFFFLLRPCRVFLDNSKKCLGYYIGSKKARRGHSKQKTPLPAKGSCESFLLVILVVWGQAGHGIVLVSTV